MWIFFIVAVAAAILIGQIIDLTAISWRIVEIASIVTGSLAVFSAITEWRRLLARNQMPYARARVQACLGTLRFVAERHLSIVELRIQRRSLNVSQYELVLPLFESLSKIAASPSHGEKSPTINLGALPASINDPEITTLHAELGEVVEFYQAAMTELQKTESEFDGTSSTDVVVFLMPILLSIAIASALFKAIYEP